MTDKIELTAVVTGCNKLWYQFQSKQVPENVFTVPVVVMNYCDYRPEMLDENGYIKIGTEVHLVAKPNSNGKCYYYPAHDWYTPNPKRFARERKTLLSSLNLLRGDNVQSINMNTQEEFDALRTEFCENMDKYDKNVCSEVLGVLAKGNISESCAFLRKLLRKRVFPEENGMIEYKSSFIHPANPLNANDKTYQLCEIIKTLTGFANSEMHKGIVIIGVKDNQEICGVENEFVEFSEQFNREKFTAMFLNLYRQLTTTNLMLQTQIEWFEMGGHLIAKIEVDYKGDIVLMNGCNLYVRKESGTHQLKGDDMLAFIRQGWCKEDTEKECA